MVFNVLVIDYLHYADPRVKKIFVWNSSDLDHILIQDDLLYKLLEKKDPLSLEDLSTSVKIYDYLLPLASLRMQTKIATLTAGDTFLRSVVRGYKII